MVGSCAVARFAPLDELHDCVDEGYMIERKAGKVVPLRAPHRNAFLANNSQIARYMPVEQTDCRVARTNRHHVHCRTLTRQLSSDAGEEKPP